MYWYIGTYIPTYVPTCIIVLEFDNTFLSRNITQSLIFYIITFVGESNLIRTLTINGLNIL